MSASALSTKMPVGSPRASRTMRPPGGSGVARVIPAISRARRFTHSAWPSTRSRYTGFSIVASRSREVGNSGVVQSFWSHPRPWSHSPRGRPNWYARTRSTTSATDRVPPRSTSSSFRPRFDRWPCASTSPGVSVQPVASMTRVGDPIQRATPSSSPTNTMRSPRTATADGARVSPFSVSTRARRSTRSAESWAAWDAAGRAASASASRPKRAKAARLITWSAATRARALPRAVAAGGPDPRPSTCAGASGRRRERGVRRRSTRTRAPGGSRPTDRAARRPG